MILSVASGKGGTGKTLVATSLALALEGRHRVQFLDCDVEEPNAHILLHPIIERREPVFIPVPAVEEGKCTYCGRCAEACAFHAIAVIGQRVLVFPELCHGCGACAYFCPEKAIIEEGREVGVVETGPVAGIEFVGGRLNVGEAMAPPVTRAVKRHIDREEVVIIDAPPGTSCPVVEAIKGSDFCLLVTEPTPFGLNDLELAVELTRGLAMSCGVVINRAGRGDLGVASYCREQGIPVLLHIPLERRIAELYCRGIPLVRGMPQWHNTFLDLFQNIAGLISVRVGGSRE